MLATGIALGLVLYGVFALYKCSFKVEEGHLAVLTTFGRAETSDGKKALKTYGPGMHWKMPWQKSVDVSGLYDPSLYRAKLMRVEGMPMFLY